MGDRADLPRLPADLRSSTSTPPLVGSIAALDRALLATDFAAAWTAASRLPRGRLGLDHALAVVVLMSRVDVDPSWRYDVVVERWIARARSDRPGPDYAELERLLLHLPDPAAAEILRSTAEREVWPVALRTLDQLLAAGG